MNYRLSLCLALAFAFRHAAAFATESAAAPGSASSAQASEAPRPARFELGMFGGTFFASRSHELLSRGPYQKYESVAPELGARAAFLPLDYVGLEAEIAAMPTKTQAGDAASLWAARGHFLGQLPLGRVTPFAVFGFGVLGAGSNALGSDKDPALHFGIGSKYAFDEFLSLRFDLRDTLTQKHAAPQGEQAHSFEATLGLSFSLRPTPAKPPASPPAPPVPDTDGDGVSNDKDVCPVEKGSATDGCPPRDTDGDGVLDDKDACPKLAGKSACGCPPVDSDGDKVIDELDRCPNEPGPMEGCPDPDADHDGIALPQDRCPDQAETKNGYEDADGCPDQLPEQVKKFTGVIAGIEFDRAKDTIRPVSTPTLEAAVKVLSDYPRLRVSISGHTDSDGERQVNVELSRRRADSVKAYFVGKGIDASRIETRGAGPDEPIADNKTAAGKQKNRRIEFKLIDEAQGPEKGQP